MIYLGPQFWRVVGILMAYGFFLYFTRPPTKCPKCGKKYGECGR